jgi:uncharacterized protein YpmB
LRFYQEIIRRLIAVERKLGSVKNVYVTKDMNNALYYGRCGQGVSQEQFDAWAKEQGENTQITIIAYSVELNKPIKDNQGVP